MNYKIALIRGDGIGPEVVGEAVQVMEAVGKKFGHSFTFEDILMGGCATDAVGVSYPEGTAEKCRACDAVLLGAVGGPKWGSDKPAEQRPETALLAIRKDLGLYANLRPAALRPAMAGACPLKKETAEKGIDLMMVRELTGGIYFGKRDRYQTEDRGEEATDLMAYSEQEIERIGRRAFELARLRRNKVSSVDKANVLETSRLWRKVMHRLAEEYSDVSYEDVLVDNCAMQLVRDPGQFDVVVTENMFGDILSDEASMVTGSIGLLPSASIGDAAPGLYEPIHGSAPDIAGQDKANPIATILSVAMMFRYSFHLAAEAQAIENAVDAVLAEGWRTADIAEPGVIPIGTREMGRRIREKLPCEREHDSRAALPSGNAAAAADVALDAVKGDVPRRAQPRGERFQILRFGAQTEARGLAAADIDMQPQRRMTDAFRVSGCRAEHRGEFLLIIDDDACAVEQRGNSVLALARAVEEDILRCVADAPRQRVLHAGDNFCHAAERAHQ